MGHEDVMKTWRDQDGTEAKMGQQILKRRGKPWWDEDWRRQGEDKTKTRRRQDEKRWFSLGRGARLPRRPSGHTALFLHRFLDLVFSGFVMGFGSLFGSISIVLKYLLHQFFEHGFCITFAWILVWASTSFSMFFGYPLRSSTQPAEPSKSNVFTMKLNDFTIHKNIMFDDFPHLFHYQLEHWFFMSFGIDFDTILESLWHQNQCFWVIVCLMRWYFERVWSKIAPDHKRNSPCFLTFSTRLCFRRFLGWLWLVFGSLLAPCWPFSKVPVLIHFESFRHKNLPLGIRICRKYLQNNRPHQRRKNSLYIYIHIFISHQE